MGRIAELRPKIQRRTANLYDTYFTRRVSIYLTLIAAKLGLTPNQVSVVGAGVGLACCAALALGQSQVVVVGAGLMHLYAVLDSVDGELARLTKRFSLTGLFIEDLSAYVMINAFNLAVAWRLHSEAGLLWPLFAAVGIAAFGRNVMPVARRALLKSVQTRRPVSQLPARPEPGKPSPLRELVIENVVHSTNQWVVLSTLLVLLHYRIVSAWLVAWVFGAIMSLLALKEAFALVRLLRNNQLEYELEAIYAAADRSAANTASGLALAKYSVL